MSLKQAALTLALAIVLSQVGLHCAHAEPPYEVALEDAFGNRLETFHHRGESFAMGRMGQRYNVRITNHTGRRVEAVVSVDGRDVISGRPGDYRNQRGYLVGPYESMLIEGFRTSNEEIAVFRFTTPGDSYSSRMGTPENVGVIGAAFFPEAAPPPPPRPVPQPYYGPYGRGSYDDSDRAEAPRRHGKSGGSLGSGGPAAAESAPAPAAPRSRSGADVYAQQEREQHGSNIGTQYGEQQYSAVVEVPFRRENARYPSRVLTLRYDDQAGLEARGIVTRPRPRPRPVSGPVAFPVNRFAPPPPPHRYD